MTRSRIRQRILMSGVLAVAFASVRPAFAAVQVEVGPGDSPICISGKVGDDSTFSKRISIIAPNADIKELIFYPGELKAASGIRVLPQQVALTNLAKIELVRNTPKAIEIKVTGIKAAGIYKGEIFFLEAGQGFKPVLKLPIEVRAEIFPTLVSRKPSDPVKIELISCAGRGCSLAQIFQPSAFTPIYSVDFDNNALGSFKAVVSVTGSGERTHRPIGEIVVLGPELSIGQSPIYTLGIPTRPTTSQPQSTPPGPRGNEQTARLVPDRYNGTVQLDLPGNQPPIKIPIEVDVRSGPFWPIVVLLTGLLIGRLLKYMKEKGGPQSDLLYRFYQLEALVSSQPEDLQLLQPMLVAVRGQIYRIDLDGAKTALDAIENRWNVLRHLRQLEQTLTDYDGNAGVPPILQNIQTARRLVSQGQDAPAATAIQQIETAVRDLTMPASAPATGRAYRMAAAQAGNARASATAATEGQPPKLPWFVRASGWLTGVSGKLRAESTLWLIRPLSYLLLVAALVIVGIMQLYLKNPIFGADPLADYFGLVVWAISSDVASRTLTALKVGS